MARGTEGLDAVVAQICAAGGSAHAYPLDLRDAEAAHEFGAMVVQTFGGPDIVISNAGHSIFRLAEDYTDRFHDVQRLFGVNALGPIAMLLPLLEAMRARGTGHLISVSAVSADIPSPGWSAYGASKTAFEAWLRAASPELAADGVSTTSVHLPLVRTAMSAPTRAYDRSPALTSAEAAAVLCRAVVRAQAP